MRSGNFRSPCNKMRAALAAALLAWPAAAFTATVATPASLRRNRSRSTRGALVPPQSKSPSAASPKSPLESATIDSTGSRLKLNDAPDLDGQVISHWNEDGVQSQVRWALVEPAYASLTTEAKDITQDCERLRRKIQAIRELQGIYSQHIT